MQKENAELLAQDLLRISRYRQQSFKPSWGRRACVTVQAPHPPLIEILLLEALFSEVLDQIKSRHTFESKKGSVNMIL